MFWCFLYLMFLNIQVFYTHEIQGVLNINQIDFTLQQSHFNPQSYGESQLFRPKRSSEDSVILLNSDTTGVKLLNDSFDINGTLNSNWDDTHNVKVVEEKNYNSSEVAGNSKRKKRDATDTPTTTPAGSTESNSNVTETLLPTSRYIYISSS